MSKRRKGVSARGPISGAVPIASAALVLAGLVGFAWHSGVLTALFTSTRMDRFAGVAALDRDDLLYLTYLDSLWRDDLAVPDTVAVNVVRLVAEEAGLPPEVAAGWGLAPKSLNALFERARELGRLRRPDRRGLLKLIRDRELHPGYVILAKRYPYSEGGSIDFCGILTCTSTMAATTSKILYYDGGRMVHGKVGDLPRIAYYGAVVPGNDLDRVYRQYLLQGR